MNQYFKMRQSATFYILLSELYISTDFLLELYIKSV